LQTKTDSHRERRENNRKRRKIQVKGLLQDKQDAESYQQVPE
jgi:hypothetical protein